MRSMFLILLAIAGFFTVSVHATDLGVATRTWPGTNVTGELETPDLLRFRGNVLTFQHPDGSYYMAFQAETESTGSAYEDDACPYFVVPITDKGTVSAVLTAYSLGSHFKVQYAKDTSFWGQRVMWVKTFMLAK